MNERMLEMGVEDSQAWHKQYKDSAYVFIGKTVEQALGEISSSQWGFMGFDRTTCIKKMGHYNTNPRIPISKDLTVKFFLENSYLLLSKFQVRTVCPSRLIFSLRLKTIQRCFT